MMTGGLLAKRISRSVPVGGLMLLASVIVTGFGFCHSFAGLIAVKCCAGICFGLLTPLLVVPGFAILSRHYWNSWRAAALPAPMTGGAIAFLLAGLIVHKAGFHWQYAFGFWTLRARFLPWQPS